jgi:hypothetical protein
VRAINQELKLAADEILNRVDPEGEEVDKDMAQKIEWLRAP